MQNTKETLKTGPASGVVTAAIPEAADTGVEILRRGGNAFDAAIAAALVETVWLPMKCGLAGDVVALFERPGHGVRSILAIGRGPLGLADGATLEATGPHSVGGFGAPEGYSRLASFGRLPLEDLVAPARRAAIDGVRWTPVAVKLTQEAEALLRQWNEATVYLPDGVLPKAGDPLRPTGLADLLEAFGKKGSRLFHGDIGDTVISHLASLGGRLTRDDLLRAVATDMPAERFDLGDAGSLFVTPHPTHGVIVGAALRAVLAGKPETDAILEARAVFDARADGGTSVVTAADDQGNRVVLVHSNSFPRYGAGVVIPGFDLVLNNRPGRGFATSGPDGHWNRPDPLSIPATTLNAWHLATGQADFWGGTPGGENQAPWNLQTIAAILQGASPQEAIDAPKWGFTPGLDIVCESDHPNQVAVSPKTVPPHSLRSAEQVIRIDRSDGRIAAGADPRTGATARKLS